MKTTATVYRSKIGPEVAIPTGAVLFGVASLLATKGIFTGLLIIGPVIIFTAHLFLTTRYIVEGTSLRVISGYLYHQTFDITAITEIKRTNSIISSPAASLDRMEIFFGHHDSVIISPKDKDGFLQHIRRINPSIQIHR